MVKLIAIVEKNFGLSENEKIPWEFKEDREFFQQKTLHSTVIMGRKTFFSHQNFPLKDRVNCIITRNEKFSEQNHSNIRIFHSIETAVSEYPDCWLIGGAQIFNEALNLNLVEEAFITQVLKAYNPDKYLNPQLLNVFSKQKLKEGKDFVIWHLVSSFKNEDIVS